MNTQVHIIHDNLENFSEQEKEKIEEMENNYDPKSEKIFEEIWDLSSDDDSIVKNIEKVLENLKIEDSDNSETSTENSNKK